MQLIHEHDAAHYLRATGLIAPHQQVNVRELSGGVSNMVMLVSDPAGKPLFVLKQARGQLRVKEPWFCPVERIWREVDVMNVAAAALRDEETLSIQRDQCPPTNVAAGNAASASDSTSSERGQGNKWSIAIPRVLFLDRENFLFAMTAAPSHQTWKQLLLAKQCDPSIAAACGRLLGQLHANTWMQQEVKRLLADQTYFEQLRLDPYYRHVARHRPELAAVLEQLIAILNEHPRCLVHGDFSPKNLLITSDSVVLVDCEVGHFGDPAFDLGFFLSHLVLKAYHLPEKWTQFMGLTEAFWSQYEAAIGEVIGPAEFASLIRRGIRCFAGCMLARVDGKSRVEYLSVEAQDRVRGVASQLLRAPPVTWQATIAALGVGNTAQNRE